ncbi:MAG: hypothetical protein ACYTEX_20855, partial [Planctomycetota bacterium]
MKSKGAKRGRRASKKHKRGDRSKAAVLFESIGGRVGLSLFLLACLIRAGYLYDSSDNPTFYAPVVDSL